jgi:hypothetical protein
LEFFFLFRKVNKTEGYRSEMFWRKYEMRESPWDWGKLGSEHKEGISGE